MGSRRLSLCIRVLGYLGEHFFFFFFREVTRTEVCSLRQYTGRCRNFNLYPIQCCMQNLRGIGRCPPANITRKNISYRLRFRNVFACIGRRCIGRTRIVPPLQFTLKPTLCILGQRQVIHQFGVFPICFGR